MSYILDALMKSERERLRRSAAVNHSLLPTVDEPSLPRTRWRLPLLGGVLVLALVPLYPRLPVPAPEPAAMPRIEPPPKPIARAAEPPQAPAASVPRHPPRRLPKAAAPPVRTEAPAPSPPTVAAPASDAPPNEPPAGAVPPQVPALRVVGVIGSAGQPAIAIVNDKLLREGDEIEPGLRLERILGDGLVFDYKGYRFKR